MDAKTIEEKEDELNFLDDHNESPPPDIVAFNELRSCADLFRMHQSKQLIIQPDFQRDVVWNNASQTRFIDSLVKQLPIPSMCISLDFNSQERLVIDGLQRMSSIIKFLSEPKWRLSRLDDIDERLSGKRIIDIQSDNPGIFSQVENVTIPITVLRCDYTKSIHMEYLFTIFHRLNTGGTKLSNQEIRNCIFNGDLNQLLRKIVQWPDTRSLLKLKDDSAYRFIYEELFLRVFTFEDRYSDYDGKLANFLNKFMEESTKDDFNLDRRAQRAQRTIKLLAKAYKGNSISESRTLIEGILVGIYRNIDSLEKLDEKIVLDLVTKLKLSHEYSPDALSEGLSAKHKVIDRIHRAIDTFAGTGSE